jgi:hypothetical protein
LPAFLQLPENSKPSLFAASLRHNRPFFFADSDVGRRGTKVAMQHGGTEVSFEKVSRNR